MARRRASFTSLEVSRSSASIPGLDLLPVSSGSLHAGQWVANPGLPGFNSNSSPQTAQMRIGNAITPTFYNRRSTWCIMADHRHQHLCPPVETLRDRRFQEARIMSGDLGEEPMKSMDTAHGRQVHEGTLTRHYFDSMRPAKFDGVRTHRALATTLIHPDSFYPGFGTIAHHGIRNRR
jgi:hypothetical protein